MSRNSTLAAILVVVFVMGALAPSAARAVDEVVAEIDGVAITLEELESLVADQLEKLARQRYQLLESAVGPLVDQRLLEGEAERRGVTPADLHASEVLAKVKKATDAEIDEWYTQNRARLRGTKEKLTPQIRTFLEQQQAQQLRGELVARLRSEHDVKILFEPLRIELTLEGATLKGPQDAKVTIVEFSDFQCPACRGFNPTLSQITKAYGEKVQVAFRQYPLRSIHPQAQKAGEASLCAREQEKFWELHDHMFANQDKLQVEQLKASAETLGLDAEAFASCLDSNRYASLVQEDVVRGDEAGVSGTPSVYVNGRPVSLGKVPTYAQLAAVIDDELARSGSDEESGGRR